MNIPRYKRLEIEWKHFAVGDATCERCGNTGESLRMVIEELRRELAPAGVKINLTETLLDKDRIAESNEIRMNGTINRRPACSRSRFDRLPLLRYACGREHLLPCDRDR